MPLLGENRQGQLLMIFHSRMQGKDKSESRGFAHPGRGIVLNADGEAVQGPAAEAGAIGRFPEYQPSRLRRFCASLP